jgi:hypothetical protein
MQKTRRSEVKKMRMLVLLLILGVLTVGAIAVTGVAEESSICCMDFSSSDLVEDSISSTPDPCGEGGNGAPPVPG